MFRRDGGDHGGNLREDILYHDDHPIIPPTLACGLAAGQGGEEAFHLPLNRLRKGQIIGDQDALRPWVMFGLRQQVPRHPEGVLVCIGNDQDL